MNYLMNHTGGADVYFNKADPHMENVRGNYCLSAVRYSLQATCAQSARTAATTQEQSKQSLFEGNQLKCAS